MPSFRTHTTAQGTVLLAGKDEASNEALVKQVLPNEEVFHTARAGSPFVVLKGIPKKGDRKEAALFCAAFSRAYKKYNEDPVEVHRFKGRNIYKERHMKIGTFGIKKFKIINCKRKEVKEWQQSVISSSEKTA